MLLTCPRHAGKETLSPTLVPVLGEVWIYVHCETLASLRLRGVTNFVKRRETQNGNLPRKEVRFSLCLRRGGEHECGCWSSDIKVLILQKQKSRHTRHRLFIFFISTLSYLQSFQFRF